MDQVPKLSVILLSPDLEKLHAGALMGSVASMSGMTVNVFVSMDALVQFRKDTISSRSFKIGTVGAKFIEKNVPLFNNLLHEGVEMGNLHVYGCALAMDVMGWDKLDLIDDVEDIIGVTKFFSLAEGGQIISI